MIELTKNLDIWRAAQIPLLNGVDRDMVLSVYRSIGWEPTPDVIAMYAQIGGMVDMDAEYWRLWSLDEVRTENTERSSSLGVYFSDYLINCWHFLLVPMGSSFSAVFRDNLDGSAPCQVAPNLEQFFAALQSDPDSVLESELRRTRRDA